MARQDRRQRWASAGRLCVDGSCPRPVMELNRGLVAANPCERGGRLYRGGGRAEKVWTADDEAAFLERAPAHLHLPLLLALWTGNGKATCCGCRGRPMTGRTSGCGRAKTGARVVIRVGAPLKAALDTTPKRSTIILTNSDGKPWTSDGFRASWGKACKAAGIVGVTFHDLRGTAVTRLALAECTEAEIATITGHSPAQRARDPRRPLPAP